MSYSITLDLKKSSNAVSFKLLLFRLFNLLSFSSLMFMPKISSTGLLIKALKLNSTSKNNSDKLYTSVKFPYNGSFFVYHKKKSTIKNLEKEEKALIDLIKEKYIEHENNIRTLILLNHKKTGFLKNKFHIAIGFLCKNKALVDAYTKKEKGSTFKWLNNLFIKDYYDYTDFKTFKKTISQNLRKIEKIGSKRKFFFSFTNGTQGKRVFGTLNDGFSMACLDKITMKNE